MEENAKRLGAFIGEIANSVYSREAMSRMTEGCTTIERATVEIYVNKDLEVCKKEEGFCLITLYISNFLNL